MRVPYYYKRVEKVTKFKHINNEIEIAMIIKVDLLCVSRLCKFQLRKLRFLSR